MISSWESCENSIFSRFLLMKKASLDIMRIELGMVAIESLFFEKTRTSKISVSGFDFP